MKSVKTKLIAYFSIIILLGSMSIGILSLQRASRALTNEAETALKSIAEEGSKLTASRIETQMRTLEMIAGRLDIQGMDLDTQLPILNMQQQRTNFLSLGIVQPDGTTYYNDGTVEQLGDRDYIKRAFNGEKNVSDLLHEGNSIFLMYSAPVEKDGKIVGVLVGRRDGNALTNVVSTMGYGNSGYAYMINSKGIVVGHPNKDLVINKFDPIEQSKVDQSVAPVANLFTKILNEKYGVQDYSFNGNDLYAGYAPVNGSDWYIVITANQSEVLRAIPLLRNGITLTVLAILLISIVATYMVGVSIVNPIIKIKEKANKLAQLDITENVEQKLLEGKDEIGDLARSLQIVTDSFRGIISEIRNTADQVAASSEELTASSQQSTVATDEVSRTIEEIARGASSQAKSTEEGTFKAIELGTIIEKDQNFLKNLNNASQSVTDVVSEGLREIEKLAKISDESNKETQEVYKGIVRTNESADRIGQASNVIATIAAQTNLLALNAAIEAARAGEHGKGFSVVAEEIRKLAEQSTESTKTIDYVVQELQMNSKSAVAIMEKVSEILKEQTESVQNSKIKYLAIADAIKEAELAVTQLNVSGKEIEKMKGEILETIQHLASIAEENSASTQEVSSSMEEQSASMEEISSASEGLSELAVNLQSVIMRFKV
ncbi:methyl-accepting chemotaxis protein [Serpentinicella alkaliphila]|uniref:Methyl-accepting chemotaxis sensory transducer with Cache sensor n=1 Tax=Serpentinicella alkaliphila TaxID=1734049 RepID=A0A4R2TK06_9FIRM|nr:methyl-accepting chemotaxis protein [Serpentinicella alkaliphila]QUH26359.1 methyl-accepting chemotaxis protein [Serpentinicella alkaliphila]TCP97618.1 methyl-accepting chemotaxis sensory transducer with Cache sensor [Serpentinicella alkaliphila]